MKTEHSFLTTVGSLIVTGMLATQSQTQASVLVSNLSETGTGPWSVSDFLFSPDRIGYDQANLFRTGATSEDLYSVVMSMEDGLAGSNITVAIYTDGGSGPGTVLSTLTGSATPDAAGLYTYTVPAPLTLAANTAYFVVATIPHTAPNTLYGWTSTASTAETGLAGWSIGDRVWTNNFTNGSPAGWTEMVFDSPTKFQLNTIPEPSSALLLAGTLGGLIIRRRKR